jgi:hypothetical protein
MPGPPVSSASRPYDHSTTHPTFETTPLSLHAIQSRVERLLSQISKKQNPSPESRETVAVLQALLGAYTAQCQAHNNASAPTLDLAQLLAGLTGGLLTTSLSQQGPEQPANSVIQPAVATLGAAATTRPARIEPGEPVLKIRIPDHVTKGRLRALYDKPYGVVNYLQAGTEFQLQPRATRQLPSGDLEIYFPSIRERDRALTHWEEWRGPCGPDARPILHTYAIQIHGVRVATMDLSDTGRVATAAELFAENEATLNLQGQINYLRWSCPDRAHKKTATTAVVELTRAEDADAFIVWGANWRGSHLKAEIYSHRATYVQCFKCQCYGHIGHRCFSSPRCALCAGSHETKQCPSPNTIQCVLCKDSSHNARSAKCPYRRGAQAKAASEIKALPLRYTSAPRETLIREAGQEKSRINQPQAPNPGNQAHRNTQGILGLNPTENTQAYTETPPQIERTRAQVQPIPGLTYPTGTGRGPRAAPSIPSIPQDQEVIIQQNTVITVSPRKDVPNIPEQDTQAGPDTDPIAGPDFEAISDSLRKKRRQISQQETTLRRRLQPRTQTIQGPKSSSEGDTSASPTESRPPPVRTARKRRLDDPGLAGPAKKTRTGRAKTSTKNTTPLSPILPAEPLFIEPARLDDVSRPTTTTLVTGGSSSPHDGPDTSSDSDRPLLPIRRVRTPRIQETDTSTYWDSLRSSSEQDIEESQPSSQQDTPSSTASTATPAARESPISLHSSPTNTHTNAGASTDDSPASADSDSSVDTSESPSGTSSDSSESEPPREDGVLRQTNLQRDILGPALQLPARPVVTPGNRPARKRKRTPNAPERWEKEDLRRRKLG